MKLTKLSLVAAFAVSSITAGGDIAPVEPAVEAPAATPAAASSKNTTVAGKLTAYYITDDSKPSDDMFGDHAQLGTAATLDVSHNLADNIALNFSAVGYQNIFGANDQDYGFLENSKNGAFFNVANITATYMDTTLIAGRQLLDTPMLGGFDWLLAPGAFEAYTLANKSIDNLTLIGSYVTKWRVNNTGDAFAKLADNNYAFGAIYGVDALSTSLWYYNVDAANYTQVYADAGYDFGTFDVAAQIASTNYDASGTPDSLAFGAKIGTKVSGFNLMAAVSNTKDNAAGFVGRDTFYTSSWNTFGSSIAVSDESTLSWKVGASTELSGVSVETSYAGYGDDGSEFDLIAGYDITDTVNIGAVYTSTTANQANADAVNAVEVFATYTF